MKRSFILVLAAMLGACTVLPHGDQKVTSKWQDFDQAMQAYEKVEPFVTRLRELDALGFSPKAQPNVRILNHAELAERLIRVSERFVSALDEGLQQCLLSGDRCYGHEIKLRVTHDQRYGNVFADMLNFKRKVETRGWEFNALIVLVDDTVVYKSWSGTPELHEERSSTNPLGPLQGVGPSLIPSPEL
jgi:hypothetical protein